MASKTKRGTTRKTRTRAPKAAALAVAGAKTSQIAEELGVSRTTVWRILRAEETQQVLIGLVNAEFDALQRLFRGAIEVLQEAMVADRPDVAKGKSVIMGGPDHYARLTAVRELRQLLVAGRPKPRPADPSKPRGLSLDELASQVGAE